MPSAVRRHPFAATLALVAVAALGLASTALAGNGGFGPVAPHSPNARGINSSYWFIVGFTGAVFLLVETVLVYSIVRFASRGRGRDVDGPEIHGSTRLEQIWTVVPVLIIAAIAAFIFVKLGGIKNVPPAGAAGQALRVRVDGHQYYWQFTYPNGVVAVDRLRAPEGEVVTLDVVSSDVVHSWWVPSLGGKIDAVPGRVNHTWFRADKTGSFTGQCAEFCGLYHASMKNVVEVLPKADFDSWLATESTKQRSGASGLGAQVFNGVCAKCHGFRGQGSYAKALVGNSTIAQAPALEDLLRQGRTNGTKVMPAVGATWSDTEMKAAIAYLQKRFGGSSGG
jgi:cytochrome c oxidase subunit 2